MNITKNIHVKSSNGEDEADEDDYAQYFPSFLWVVRDFSLQLVDEEGDQITSREYLENALMPQKGFSETIENKNRIRRMIQSFFKDRDCYTLIRPLLDEGDLQNLQGMEIEHLRPDFVEQVLNLRKRIMTRFRMKTIDDKPLSGEMLVGLMKNWVRAINEGAVPNIESAWTYICRDQCHQALENCYNDFEEGLSDSLSHSWPVSEGYIRTLFKDLKENAISNFKRAAVGEYADEKLQELLNRIHEKHQYIEAENRREYEALLRQGLDKNYQAIDKKLREGEFKNFFDYEKELRKFQSFFMDLDPNGPNKELIISEFILKKQPEAVYLLIKDIRKENDEELAQFKSIKTKLENDLHDVKEETANMKNLMQNQISDLETDKSDLRVKLQCVTDNLEILKEKSSETEKKLKSEYEEELAIRLKKIEELEKSKSNADDLEKEMERKLIIFKSEFEKEKALLEQKLKFYEENYSSYAEKEKGITDQILIIKEDHKLELTDVAARLNGLIREKETQIKVYDDRLGDTEEELRVAQDKLRITLQEASETERKLKEQVSSSEARLEALSEELTILREKGRISAECEENPLNVTLTPEILDRIKELEESLEEKCTEISQKNTQFEKEKALLKQNIQFLETQLSDTRNQIENTKKIHEQSLKALEGQTHKKVDINKQVKDLQEAHAIEIKQLHDELDNSRTRLNSEIEKLTEERDNLLLKYDKERNQLEEEVSRFSAQMGSIKEENEKLVYESRMLEDTKSKLVKELEENAVGKVKRLEEEMEELKENHIQEIEDIQTLNEEQFRQMKQFFEEEKMRLEVKLHENKDKYEKKIRLLIEEYDHNVNRTEQDHEEEIENLQQELRELEIQHMASKQHYEQEINMRQQVIDTMEKELKDAKSQLNNLQSSQNFNLEQTIKNFNEERTSLLSKLETLKTDLTEREKELYAASQSVENLSKENSQLKEKVEKYKSGNVNVVEELKSKVTEYKEKYDLINDEYMNKKIDFEKNIALTKQQLEFYQKRLQELQVQLDSSASKLEERLRIQREEHRNEINKLISQNKQEKDILEGKLDEKKKALKEIESNYRFKFEDLERENASLTERCLNLDAELSKGGRKAEDEIIALTEELQKLKKSGSEEKKKQHAELSKRQKKIHDLELRISDLENKMDTEKELFKGQIKFIESQRDQYKQDLEENRQQFELTISKMSNFSKADKEEEATTQAALISSMEQSYQKQISDQTERFKYEKEQLLEKYDRLEKDFRVAQDKYRNEIENNSSTAVIALEEKLEALAESEKKLRDQVKELKKDRDSQILEYQMQLDRDREQMKKRIKELESKYKDAENRKNNYLFEHERERAKWNVEKDHLISQKSDFMESVGRLEKRVESLLRENEKLRNENRKNKKLLGNNYGNNLTNLATGNLMYNNMNTSKFDRSYIGGA